MVLNNQADSAAELPMRQKNCLVRGGRGPVGDPVALRRRFGASFGREAFPATLPGTDQLRA
jgi:hypothetical protein